MLSIAHTLISLPFAVYFENPFLIFIAAFVFHLFSDTLLHWNVYAHRYEKYPSFLVAVDVIGGVLIAWFLIGNPLFTIPMLAAIAGGNMPDILNAFWDILKRTGHQKHFKILTPFFDWHDKLQLETNNMWHGLISQILLTVIACLLVI